jgi:hypothetical protein
MVALVPPPRERELPTPGSQRCISRKAGEAGPERQGSEAKGAVRDPWSQIGSAI